MPFPTPSSVWTWLVATWQITWWRSWLNEDTPSQPPPSEKSSVTSRRSCATSPSTSSRKWPPPLHPRPSRSPTSFPTVRLSPSETRGSGAQRPSSSLHSWEWSLAVSTRPPTTQSWSVTSTSGRTCTPTQSCLEAPPCTPALPTVCRRRSLPWPHQQWRSKSSPHQRGSTPSGSEVPSLLPFPPSNRCGSPSRSTTSLAHPSSTGSASKPSRGTTATTFTSSYNINASFKNKQNFKRKVALLSCWLKLAAFAIHLKNLEV